MNKLFLILLSTLFILVGCGQEEVDTKNAKTKVELVSFVNPEISQIDEEELYFEALSYLFVRNNFNIHMYYDHGSIRSKESYLDSLSIKELNLIWESVYLDYKIINYSYYYYLNVSPTSINVLAPNLDNRIDKLQELKMKDLMIIHNAFYSKTNGKEKKLDSDFLDYDDASVQKMQSKYKDVVLTKDDILDNTPKALKALSVQLAKGRVNHTGNSKSGLRWMYRYYGREISDFIYSRIAYDIAKLQYDSLNANNTVTQEKKITSDYEFFNKVITRIKAPSFGQEILQRL